MIILDTDIASILFRGNSDVALKIRRQLDVAGAPVSISVISVEEQFRGWTALIARARTTDRLIIAYKALHDFVVDLRRLQILELDDKAAAVLAKLRKSRVRIGTMDLRIAAIAIANNALLISRNLTDFAKVPGLRVEDWMVGA